MLSGQPSALLALLTAGNCRNPYRDTVENGSTLGKSGIHDPQPDPEPRLPTHTVFCSTTHTFRAPVRWRLFRHHCLWLGSWRNPHKRHRSWRQARKTGTVFSQIPRPRKSLKWPALPVTVTQSRRRPLAPTLSPALFSHPPFSAQCPGYVRCPQPSPNLSSQRRKILFFTEAIPCLHALLTGPAGPAFSFSASPWLFSPTPHQGEVKPIFSHLGSPLPFNSSTTGSHSFNGAGNPFRWCRSPTWSQKPHTGSHKAKFGFHRLFLVRFFYGREAKSLSSL